MEDSHEGKNYTVGLHADTRTHARTHARMHARKLCEEGKSYLKEHVLLTGRQVHLILIVINTDVDNVCQQLLIAWDHFQLLVKTLNNSATHWSGGANVFLHHPEGPEPKVSTLIPTY